MGLNIDPSAFRQQLWQAGLRPVPVYNFDDKGPSPGKRPLGVKWQLDALRDPPFCAVNPAVPHAQNTGVLCDGLRAIDIDVDDAKLAARCLELAQQMLPPSPKRFREGSARCLLVFRAASGEPPNAPSVTGASHDPKGQSCKIEVLGKGHQFVAGGRHHSGADIQWQGDLRLDALASVTEAQINAYRAAVAPIIGAPAPGYANGKDHKPASEEELQGTFLAIAHDFFDIDNSAPSDWPWWAVRVGAVHAALGDTPEAWAIVREWSARNPAYDPAEVEAKWRQVCRSPFTGVGAKAIADWAARDRRARDRTDPREEVPPVGDEPPQEDGKPRLRLLGMAELLAAPPRDYIVKGWLAPAETSLIVGAKNTRKSFIALHTGYAIAQGRARVWGRRLKQVPVLYVICEGVGGLSQRIRALRSKFGDCSGFWAIAQPIDLLRSTWKAGDLREVIERVQQIEAGMVFLDTVSRVMQGGKENAPEDMGAFAGNIGELAYRTGAHVCGVHHGTKAEGTSSRGHTILPNAMEAVATVEWDNEAATGSVELEFARDDITGPIGSFRTETIDLGTDQDGDKITSLVIEETSAATAKRSRGGRPAGEASTHAARAFEILADLCAREGRTGYGVPHPFQSVPAEWWRARWNDRAMPAELADTKGKAFRRASSSLTTGPDAKVGMLANRVWIARPEPEPGHRDDAA